MFLPADLPPATPPNIVLIITDDLGVCDLGYYGNQDADTPHLDALAANSLRQESFYVTPVCAPTRAALLTGRHHLRTGVAGVHGGKDHVNLAERTIAELLSSGGYATGLWGKWHSGMSDGYQPHQRGFDETLLLQLYKHRDPFGTPNGGERIPYPGQWGDDVIVDAALDFARRHPEQPYFAMVASMTPHGPLDAPEEDIARVMQSKGMSRELATLHAQMTSLDQAIGRLLTGLEALATNDRETIVLFMSDNGPAFSEDHFSDADRDRRNVLGWRGWKGDVWEAGIRSPLWIHRIGKPTPGEVTQVADVTDLYPTFAAWAGITLPADQKPLDGRDISPMLRGETMSEKPVYTWVHPAIPPASNRGDERILQDEYGPVTPEAKTKLTAADQVLALRHGEWKITRNADLNKPAGPHPTQFLGNLANDPKEQTDLLASEPRRAATLNGQLDDWWQEIIADPATFQAPDIIVRATGDTEIRATTTARISPSLLNTVPAITGFATPGQSASWNLQAEATRHLTPALNWFRQGKLPPGSRVAMECSGSRVTGVVDADHQINWDGLLTIDAGPNTLTFTLLEIPAGQPPLDLFSIKLSAE